MKNVTKILYHMIAWAMILPLCQASTKNVAELLLFSLGSALIAGICLLLRIRVKKPHWFIGSHLLGIAATIYGIGVLYGKGVLAFMLVLPIVWSLILRLLPAAAWLDNPSGIYVGTLVVVYVIHWIYKVPQYVKTMTVVATVLLFLIQQLYKNIDAADRFVDMRTMSTKINTKSVKSLSKQISLIYVGMMGSVLAILGVIGIDSVWQFLANVGDKIMRFIVSLIPEGEPPVYEQTFDKVNNNTGGGLDALAKESPIMQKIGEIFAFVGGIVILLAFAFLLIRGIVLLIRYFGTRQNETEEQLVREKLYVGKEKSVVKQRRLFRRTEQTPARKVRKIYKRNMQKLDDTDVRQFSYLNPEEQVGRLQAYRVDEATREEIKEIYERARYSAEKVTDADAKRMQAIM